MERETESQTGPAVGGSGVGVSHRVVKIPKVDVDYNEG